MSRWSPSAHRGRRDVDLSVRVGSVELANPIMCASGTAGHGDELGRYLDLSALGAVVVKSLSAEPWPGNPPPRVHETTAGMINSVGLQGPGIEVWLRDELPALVASGATVVASIWGRTVEEYERAAKLLASAPAQVAAVEVNLSCPNLDGGRHLFAHDPAATAEVMAATAACGRPRWAKLSPNTDRIVEVAHAARASGADAVTLVNTLLGMAIDPETRSPRLGAGGGGVSGPAIHPIAVRAVYDCRASAPDLPIVGVGGVSAGEDAVEMMLAGANAVQVGTASFADPRACGRVLDELVEWCQRHGVSRAEELPGGAHGRNRY
jgi:dihydroorotate dehydrogenase (NAD+) catalytic subunit